MYSPLQIFSTFQSCKSLSSFQVRFARPSLKGRIQRLEIRYQRERKKELLSRFAQKSVSKTKSAMKGDRYLIYSSNSQVANLDQNTVIAGGLLSGTHDPTQRVTVFPGRIYAAEAFPVSQYVCQSGPRDTHTDYLYRFERFDHPQTFSRFGYADCDNGYCTGNWSRGYKTPGSCFDTPDPAGMAPPRFYTPDYHSPFVADSSIYNASRDIRLALRGAS